MTTHFHLMSMVRNHVVFTHRTNSCLIILFSKFCVIFVYVDVGAGIAQSVWQLAMGWTVRGSNPGGGEIFRTRPDLPCGPPSLLYSGYQVFPEGKAAGAWY
jgi:hypothetical protein